MQSIQTSTLQRALIIGAGLLIVKVTVAVVMGYVNYLPPNFDSDFLRGRDHYFWNGYHWAFYPHIAAGPVSLILGLILMSARFRTRFPGWHRSLGRVQGVCVLGIVVPSGLWMAWYAATGLVATVAFALLAVFTGTCMTMGWRMAVKRRFADHRIWMWRTLLLLCSAVVLRVVAGFATIIEVQSTSFDPIASWACWVVPLTIFELSRRVRLHPKRSITASLPAAS